MTFQELEQEALRLSPADRERLVARLLWDSDDGPSTEMDDATFLECERRHEELRSGLVQGIPGDQVIQQIRRELGWER